MTMGLSEAIHHVTVITGAQQPCCPSHRSDRAECSCGWRDREPFNGKPHPALKDQTTWPGRSADELGSAIQTHRIAVLETALGIEFSVKAERVTR